MTIRIDWMKRMGCVMLLLSLLVPSARAEDAVSEPAHELPDGFCYVHEWIDDVILDIRYAGHHNFVGDVIDGYEAPYAILTNEAARHLKEAADEFREMGYRIMIFDAYRPQSAVKHFVRWAGIADDMRMQEEFYPEYKKKILLVDQGYIARNSSHCRGSAVDLTITDLEGNALDMGTGFDYFGKLAWHGAKGVTPEQAANREILCSVMEKHGFRRFDHEWWHYKLVGEPFDEGFNFPVR
ncbi:MAG: M15 family metallopeptidase [Clostridia bacterium]|nr:M15 family metallopeptidase [Clostridia bacterium]